MASFLDKFKFMRKPFRAARPVPKKTEDSSSAVSEPVSASERTATGDAHRILRNPVVSEKAAHLADQNQYVFEVAVSANKNAVAEAVEQVYGVKPRRVHIVMMPGKEVRFGGRVGTQKTWKKAIVTLPTGKRIKLFEEV